MTPFEFQSTPPCGGDIYPGGFFHHPGISIHAPLRGRPAVSLLKRAGQSISIHAPLRGRLNEPLVHFPEEIFQSTPPCGGDEYFSCTYSGLPISIHAPLRGRLHLLLVQIHPSRFQSTPPCGGDSKRKLSSTESVIFQSTPPCGGDPTLPVRTKTAKDFNPRPLAGATLSL